LNLGTPIANLDGQDSVGLTIAKAPI